MSDTPRTDEAVNHYDCGDKFVEFCRQLERELNECKNWREFCKNSARQGDVANVILERDQLRAELHETHGAVMSLQLRCKDWREVALKLSAAAKQVAYNLAAKPDYNELNFALAAVERLQKEDK